MIVVTGAAGFIGSCLVRKLNELGFERDIVVVDDFYKDYKDPNLDDKFIRDWVHRDLFQSWFKKVHKSIDFVFHLGARTDTVETNKKIFDKLNVNFSKELWNTCTEFQIPLVYASSAATYGNGENGFSDDHKLIRKLKPLNEYGKSKHSFDTWALKQKSSPPKWIGLKFFNVYGPNEYYKGRMASVMMHFTKQARTDGKIRLFKSHRDDVKNGEQARDFVYVKDVIDVCCRFMNAEEVENGIYNVGTGKANTYLELAQNIWKTLGKTPKIEFIDTPEDIRDNYQYFSEADLTKLDHAIGKTNFYSLEAGIEEYLDQYLLRGAHF